MSGALLYSPQDAIRAAATHHAEVQVQPKDTAGQRDPAALMITNAWLQNTSACLEASLVHRRGRA